MIGRRRHPRRQPATVHRPPPVAPETPEEVLERGYAEAMAVYDDARGEVGLEELGTPPPLSKLQIAKLEALTAGWIREVRVGGPMPEDTLLYGAPKPPVPARRGDPADYEPEPLPVVDVEESNPIPVTNGERSGEAEAVSIPHAQAPRVVRDWVSRHDPRSREFDVRARLRARVPVQDRVWDIGPVFDQGSTPPLSLRDASGCVGMAVAAAANVIARGTDRAYIATAAGLLSKADALGLYDRAQELDHISGEKYAGTSVLAGMLAGREAGLWAEFLWAFGTRDIAQAVLQIGPVVVGVPWDERLDKPDPAGVITPGGAPAGGHALAVVGLVTKRGQNSGPYFVLQQSRGESEGDRGLVYLHHRHLSALLAGVGEAAIPVPPGMEF